MRFPAFLLVFVLPIAPFLFGAKACAALPDDDIEVVPPRVLLDMLREQAGENRR